MNRRFAIVAGLGLLTAGLTGCGHSPETVSQELNQAQSQVEKASQDLQQKAQKTLAQWNSEANQYIQKIQRESKLDDQAKAWVEQTLADGQQMGRLAAARVAAAAGKADQQARAWAEQEIRQAIDQAVGQEKAQLQEILNGLRGPQP